MDEDLGRMLAAPLNGNICSVDWQDHNSSIRDNSRHSRAAIFSPPGGELLTFEKMPGQL